MNTKKSSKQVQNIKQKLDRQLGFRLSEKYIINAAFNKFKLVESGKTMSKSNTKITDISIGKSLSKYKFHLHQEKEVINVNLTWISKTKKQNLFNQHIWKAIS